MRLDSGVMYLRIYEKNAELFEGGCAVVLVSTLKNR